MKVARDQLAGKEMAIGRYYMERRDYTGAINRFKTVVTRYQTTRHVEEALARLTEAYMAIGIVGEAQTAAAVLGHNFPDSRWYKDAYNLVKSAVSSRARIRAPGSARPSRRWGSASPPFQASAAGFLVRISLKTPRHASQRTSERHPLAGTGLPCLRAFRSATSS